ncbi:hypothetical protein [Natronorubrum bangense]|uniref:DUF8173 domain-containing protein n=2 Tax=Natronorubrum bangense TaxID=61858 RepID=L9WT84_9EURY|nr:hypothetical protein [Natronorubrum bangense]ELY52431.1 hypothetical protein C494_01067 [Natronorubrum bangense JCM 10635]QCC55230.1 hypothetical protein DV706_12580 [Natronorubrum bangense]
MSVLAQSTLTALFVAQAGPSVDIGIGTADNLAGGAVGAFLTTLIVGAIMIAVVPEYTERMMGDVLDEPIGSFVYGLIALVAVLILAFVFFITIIGILVALPLLLVVYLLWAIGSVIAYLAIAERLIGRGDSWLKPLLVAAGLNGVLTLTGIGGLIAFCIGAAGFGTVLRSGLS